MGEPLAARMRPRSLDEVVGQGHLLGPGKALSALTSSGNLPSIVLWGPAGTGKTTIAHLLARAVGAEMVQLSAVSSGVADARKVIAAASGGMLTTVLFVDEVHRWSKAQQDVLLPAVEEGTVTFIGATTENPYFSLVSPLLSRSLLLRLEPLTAEEVRRILERALDDPRGLPDAKVEDEALAYLAQTAGGDARLALSGLEAATSAAAGSPVTREMAEDVVQRGAVVYDEDEHYDVISAFIKSMRGSDADASLFWLARMLDAGEDPRFIARRMVIFASEDVGLADPQALLVAVAAAHAVEFVGLPEVRLNLAQAAAYLARAPKSNAVFGALGAATEAQKKGGRVPPHLRDAHYPGATKLGHGEGYED
ncbi:MAG TPA: replication-associated recombination protein A [Actinomycetota bacterium]